MNISEQGDYVLEFLETYHRFTDQEKGKREAACLSVQYKRAILSPMEGDILCGRYESPCIGFALQDSGMGYYLNEGEYERVLDSVPESMRERLMEAMESWKEKTGKEQLTNRMPEDMLEMIPNDHFDKESNVGFWLCRMSSTQLDFDKLLKLGLKGLAEEITQKACETSDEEANRLYEDMLCAIEAVRDILQFQQCQILSSNHSQKDSMAEVLEHIISQKPETLHQAVQLMYLYAIISGSYNYGRMDEYLGDFLAADLESGIIDTEEAKDILRCLWRLMIQRKTTWDGRVVIGGTGRRNEKYADACAHLILEVTDEIGDVLPQLSLRFGKEQNQDLLEHAMQTIGTGCVYPILYNDDVNIPAVQKAFQVPYQEAVHYVPFGCGEYILYHRSVGTPSDVINLLKALEITIFDGFDHVSHKQIGLRTGDFTEFETFTDFLQAYYRQVERYVDMVSRQQRLEYRVAEEHSPFLLASILYDDCISRGRAIFHGGVRYLGGTLESYGNTNTADSLSAIKRVVFEEGLITKQELKDMLLQDFKGYEKQRQQLCSAPKYGNDDAEADEMAKMVHRHICLYTGSCAEKIDLDTYLVVVINNSANTTMGKFTLASPDGRHAYEPMANANNPSGGNDSNGLTAVLNSLVKLPVDIHGGSVQNIMLSKDMFTTYFEKTKAMLNVYFDKGGAQLMVNVLHRGELEQALMMPERYQNLIVRVGGFCARFVELEPKVQQEIMSRTMY